MLNNFISIMMSVRILDIIDVVVVAYLVYMILVFIEDTRAQLLLRAIIVIVAVFAVSELLELKLLSWLLKSLITMGLFAIIVIFQPELRRGLEILGRKTSFFSTTKDFEKEEAMEVVSEIVDAVEDFSKTRTGALIVIERTAMLTDIVEKSAAIDAKISARLLGNLFYEGSPLHDGAVIISEMRIVAASCVLPLTEKVDIGGKNLGTRHRAAVGVSEVSDALVIVVSEESGAVSIAENGKLKRFVDAKTLEKMLLGIYFPI